MTDCCKNPKDSKQIEELADLLKIISEPNRLRIICLLKSGKKCVCEIQQHLDLKQNLVSHHLKVLSDCGLISHKKKGQWKHYHINKQTLKTLNKTYAQILIQMP